MYLLIITGMSGAGKSHALRKLEDMGFLCVDNLPCALLHDFAAQCEMAVPAIQNAAVVMDVRERGFLNGIAEAIAKLGRNGKTKAELLFLDARDEIIIKRYKETRRVHPFSSEGWIEQGIESERQALAGLLEMADYVIDTSDLKPAQMFVAIEAALKRSENIKVFVSSFGFKRGIPLDADWVLDVRFLPNPFYIEDLRQLSGMDKPVREYVFSFEASGMFLENLVKTLSSLIPMYENEDKHLLSVAIGCTGGQHRSVAFAQALYEALLEKGIEAYIHHRDINKDTK